MLGCAQGASLLRGRSWAELVSHQLVRQGVDTCVYRPRKLSRACMLANEALFNITLFEHSAVLPAVQMFLGSPRPPILNPLSACASRTPNFAEPLICAADGQVLSLNMMVTLECGVTLGHAQSTLTHCVCFTLHKDAALSSAHTCQARLLQSSAGSGPGPQSRWPSCAAFARAPPCWAG